MPTEHLTLFLTAETALHPGSGSTLSDIDLPIQRQVHTGHPVVYGSGVKGALRELAQGDESSLTPQMEAVFGPDTPNASDHAGLAAFVEARVLLFPVASFDSVFVWVTCPMVLHGLKRDLAALRTGFVDAGGSEVEKFLALPVPNPNPDEACTPAACPALINGSLYLDECEPFKHHGHKSIDDLAQWLADNTLPAEDEYKFWRDRLRSHLAVISDVDYTFLVRYRTHIEPHVSIGANGTVEAGPWMEESLPPETILAAHVVCRPALDEKTKQKLGDRTAKDCLKELFEAQPRWQMCGSQSTGKGWVARRLLA